MLLHEGECVICDSEEETLELAVVLEDAGFKMFESHFGTITQCSKDKNQPDRQGWRWFIHHPYPNCIAGMDAKMCDEVETTGELTDGEGRNPHTWISFSEFMRRLHPINVEGLI